MVMIIESAIAVYRAMICKRSTTSRSKVRAKDILMNPLPRIKKSSARNRSYPVSLRQEKENTTYF